MLLVVVVRPPLSLLLVAVCAAVTVCAVVGCLSYVCTVVTVAVVEA